MDIDKVNYQEMGAIAQVIKHQMRTGLCWTERSSAEQESLDQIATLIARMVSGDDDAHWNGIIAYASAATTPAEPPMGSIERVDIDGDIRRLAREVPQRNGGATS
jgi:hypothetical protein